MIPHRNFGSPRRRVFTGPSPEEKLAGIKECLYAGDYIQAVDIYRAWKGVDLQEAKAAVEQLDRDFMAASPQPFLEYAWRKGWIGVIIVILTALGAVAWTFNQK